MVEKHCFNYCWPDDRPIGIDKASTKEVYWKKHPVKVRSFPGASIDDMHHCLYNKSLLIQFFYMLAQIIVWANPLVLCQTKFSTFKIILSNVINRFHNNKVSNHFNWTFSVRHKQSFVSLELDIVDNDIFFYSNATIWKFISWCQNQFSRPKCYY